MSYFAKRLSYRDAVLPILIATVVNVWLAQAQRPFFMHAMLQSLPPGAEQRMTDIATSKVFRFSGVGSAAVPIVTIGLNATLAFLILGAAFRTPRFEALTACVAWSTLLLTGQDLTRYAWLVIRGMDAIQTPGDVVPGMGLGFLAVGQQSVAYDVLELVSGFNVAYVVVLVFAIHNAEKTSLRLATAAALVPWLLGHSVSIGFSVLFRQ